MAARDKPILLIEDSEEDVLLFKRTLEKAGLANPIQVVNDVDAAIGHLEGTAKGTGPATCLMPSIAVMDLQMPNKDGFDFLRWLGTQPQLRNLHVVVMTDAGRMLEINRAYRMGANSFLTKPIKEQDLRNLAEGFAAYWT